MNNCSMLKMMTIMLGPLRPWLERVVCAIICTHDRYSFKCLKSFHSYSWQRQDFQFLFSHHLKQGPPVSDCSPSETKKVLSIHGWTQAKGHYLPKKTSHKQLQQSNPTEQRKNFNCRTDSTRLQENTKGNLMAKARIPIPPLPSSQARTTSIRLQFLRNLIKQSAKQRKKTWNSFHELRKS